MSSRYISNAIEINIRKSKNSTLIAHKHACTAVFISGPRRGEVFTSACNIVTPRINHPSERWIFLYKKRR